VMMPDIDGYETCLRIRQATLTKYIPVIFLTQRDERANKVKGLELGADDYVTKPFDLDELRLRVQGAIRRATRENLHETRTGLPTGQLVEEEITRRQLQDEAYTDLRLGINDYKAYCDVYGFLAGDEVMGFAGKTIQQSVSELGTANDFVGIVDDYFVVLTHSKNPGAIEELVRQRFQDGIKAFYSFADAERGGLLLHSGTEQEQMIPLMGVVSLQASV
jgi:CheY-like chemotaxis protein